jgi:hypothetical protein
VATRVVAALAALVLVLAPRLAEACPVCAGQNDGGSARLIVIGAMIVTPFVAVALCVPWIVRTVRKLGQESRESLPEPSDHD